MLWGVRHTGGRAEADGDLVLGLARHDDRLLAVERERCGEARLTLQAAQSEVVRAIWCPAARFIRIRGDQGHLRWGSSPCCGVPHRLVVHNRHRDRARGTQSEVVRAM